jgi:hypothetical protein
MAAVINEYTYTAYTFLGFFIVIGKALVLKFPGDIQQIYNKVSEVLLFDHIMVTIFKSIRHFFVEKPRKFLLGGIEINFIPACYG